MKLSLVSFTAAGERLAERLAKLLAGEGDEILAACCLRGAGERPSLGAWTDEAFAQSEGLLFVGACGIAVRAVGPLLKSKLTDPAVLSVDEQGRFVVPLVSGHLGGANALAHRVARLLGATAVISTATDLCGRFAVDLWAKEQGLCLSDMGLAKAVSAALLEGNPVGFASDFPVAEPLPEGFAEEGELGLCVTLEEMKRPFAKTLVAVPRIVTLGLGCRRGVDAETIERVARAALAGAGIAFAAVGRVASIDLKAEEPGLLAFCQRQKLPFFTDSAAVLARVEGTFTPSAFVRGVTGVDNVCERAAAAEGGRLLLKKYGADGVTVAAAAADWRVRFAHPEKEEFD